MQHQGYDLQSVENAVQLRLILKDAEEVRFEFSEGAAARPHELLQLAKLCADRDMVSDFSAELKLAESELDGVIRKLRQEGLLVLAGKKRELGIFCGRPDVAGTALICVMQEEEINA